MEGASIVKYVGFFEEIFIFGLDVTSGRPKSVSVGKESLAKEFLFMKMDLSCRLGWMGDFQVHSFGKGK